MNEGAGTVGVREIEGGEIQGPCLGCLGAPEVTSRSAKKRFDRGIRWKKSWFLGARCAVEYQRPQSLDLYGGAALRAGWAER